MEKWSEGREKHKERVCIEFGPPSHEKEYIITTPWGNNNPPFEWENALQAELGNEWDVMHRESRIELVRKDYTHREADDKLMRAAVSKIMGPDFEL